MANNTMTLELLRLVQQCIRTGNLLPFYKTRAWSRTRNEVLRLDHFECQACKRRGRHRRGKYVHHINHLKDRPELGLSIWYEDEHGEQYRNLETLCFACHELEHPHRLRAYKPPLTPELW